MNATGPQSRIALKNILYATDFSPAAEAALPYVLGLAKGYGAKVHALHIRALYPVMVGPEAMPQVMEAQEEQAKIDAQRLHEIFSDVPHDVSIREGDLWATVAEMVHQKNVDLIVLGTRGRTGVERALLGSVAEEVFRQAPCPVLTVGPHVSKDTKRRLEMKQILFATNFSAESLSALPYALSMAQEHQARSETWWTPRFTWNACCGGSVKWCRVKRIHGASRTSGSSGGLRLRRSWKSPLRLAPT
jgi:nucleotide-binding universal stress UspA family protein